MASIPSGDTAIRTAILCFALPILALSQTTTTQVYQPGQVDDPITSKKRLDWFLYSTVGPASLAGGVISAGFGTWMNQPKEYGPHWSGFGQRYGMRLTGISVGNAMEAGLGSFWGEDPRYHRVPDEPFKSRVGHIVKMTFLANNRDGGVMPAYARFVAIPSNNFLSNAWRADSEATVDRAIIRTGLGFLGRMSGNAFEEFWPDVKQRMFHHQKPGANPIP